MAPVRPSYHPTARSYCTSPHTPSCRDESSAGVEHVTSGRVAHVTSLRGLMAFLADVLRDGAPED